MKITLLTWKYPAVRFALYRKLKETYVDVFPVEITVVNLSYNASMKWNISYEEQIQ